MAAEHRADSTRAQRVRLVRLLAAPLLVLGWTVCPAHGSVQSLYGVGARGPALVNALSASVRGPAASHYNPAALAAPGPPEIEVGISYFAPVLEADGARGGAERSINASFGLSTMVPLGGLLAERVYFGATLHVPTEDARLVQIFLPDDDEAFFVPFTNAAERLVLVPGLALRLVPGLSIGFSLDFFPFDSPNLQSGRVGRLGSFELNGDLSLLADFIPRAGIWLDGAVLDAGLSSFSFGLVYRDEFDAEFSLPALLDVGFPIDLVVEGRTAFVPRQLVGGVEWRVGPRSRLLAELVWYDWSSLPSPRIRVRVAGLDQLLPIESLAEIESSPVSPALDDSFAPRLAFEWAPATLRLPDPVLRLGYSYEPSLGHPTDDPLLFTNARHVVSAGFECGGRLELDEMELGVKLAVFFQAHVLQPQTRAAPGAVGEAPRSVQAGGWVGATGLMILVEL